MPLFKDKFFVEDNLIEELRSMFLEELKSNPEDEIYHPDDIRRVKENDWYIARYILHMDKDVEKAYRMLTESLKFRKDMEINTLKKKDLPLEYFNTRAVILYNHDKRNHPIVVIRCKTHFKKEETRRLQQQYMLYWVEKALRASDWGVISVMFDCTDSGVANMDLDMIRFILNVFKKYCPWALGFFIVCNMPWYLSAFWKIIKQWVPERYVGKVIFVDSTSIREYIEEDQLPTSLGGTSTKLYEPKEGVEEDFESEAEIPLVTAC